MLPDLMEDAGYETSIVAAIPMAKKAVGDRFQSVWSGLPRGGAMLVFVLEDYIEKATRGNNL